LATNEPSRASNIRGDATHEYLSAKSRACGLGSVTLFHGWRLSTALPSGSWLTNVDSFVQSSKYDEPSRIRIARLISTRSVVISSPLKTSPGVTYRWRPHSVMLRYE
jgi:hypothetical protein